MKGLSPASPKGTKSRNDWYPEDWCIDELLKGFRVVSERTAGAFDAGALQWILPNTMIMMSYEVPGSALMRPRGVDI